MKCKLILVSFLLLVIASYAQKNKVNAQTDNQINWSSFMAKQSLQWDSLSTNYYSGILLGNGLLGANIYKENDQSIRVDIGRTDVVDQRAKLYPNVDVAFNSARLQIGYFSLKTQGKIIGSNITLDIYNATAKGSVITTKGTLEIFAFVQSNKNVVVVRVNKTGNELVENPKWNPGQSRSPRMEVGYPVKPENYPYNPPVKIENVDQFTLCNQPMLNGGGYTTAYKRITKTGQITLIASIGYDKFSGKDENKEAIDNLKDFEKQTFETNLKQHQEWWHNYYPKSFVALPDKRIENFYWIQFYKLASATRSDKPMLDLMGPWTTVTPWPAIWWNLNTQLAYSPIYAANHLELGQPLFKALDDNHESLINNVPEKWRADASAIGRVTSYDLLCPISESGIASGNFESSNLVWAMHNYYQYYAYSKDTVRLVTKIYPLLKRATNFMIHLLEKDDKGVYHFVNSISPEYKSAVDANYALASLRWGLTTLIKLNKEQNLQDNDVLKYEEILKNLVPYPTYENGYLIGKDVALTSSHRHYSHLMMIHPYYLVNWDQPENHEIISKSIEHWLSMPAGLAGFSFTGSASMYASINNADKALAQINVLMDRFIQPNTLYKESGPVIESSLACATSIQDLLLQSWGDKIRIFPAIPSTWKNVAFKDLRTEGAFLVSAIYKDGKTQKVEIKSLKGGDCQVLLKMDNINFKSSLAEAEDFIISPREDKKLVFLRMKPNQIITLLAKGSESLAVNTINYTINPNWSWGLNKNNTNRNAN